MIKNKIIKIALLCTIAIFSFYLVFALIAKEETFTVFKHKVQEISSRFSKLPTHLNISRTQGEETLAAVQYKVQEIPLNLENLSEYLSTSRTQNQKTKVEYGFLSITTAENDYTNPSTYNIADIDGISTSYKPLIEQVKEALSSIGFMPAEYPHLFLSAKEAYEIFSTSLLPQPITYEEYLKDHKIPLEYGNTTFLCSIAQTINGIPIYDRIEDGTSDQFSSNYALLWIDDEGKIISGNIHLPYEITKEAPLNVYLRTSDEAKEAILVFIKELDGTFKEFYEENHLALDYVIESVEPCLNIDTNYIAIPGWQIMLHTTYTNTQTGQISHTYWDGAVNGLSNK